MKGSVRTVGQGNNGEQYGEREHTAAKPRTHQHAREPVPRRDGLGKQGIHKLAQGMEQGEGEQCVSRDVVKPHGAIDTDAARNAHVAT